MIDRADPPEVLKTCPECEGEGSIEVCGGGISRWSIDPPSTHTIPCDACAGSGFMIEEAEGDQPEFAEEACPGHVASDHDAKVCRRCGVHIESLRP